MACLLSVSSTACDVSPFRIETAYNVSLDVITAARTQMPSALGIRVYKFLS